MRISSLLPGAIAGALVAGCASAPADSDRLLGKAMPIAPYAMQEACVKLGEGDRLDYRFTTTEPVAFNLHYHEGHAVVMPISREHATEEAGVFRATTARDFCLMWEAAAAGAMLTYEARVRRAGR